MSLTPKRHRFVEEYLVDLNATAAAVRAGYSRRSPKAQGSRLLKDGDVAAAIQKAIAERSERTQVTTGSVMQELARIAFADPCDVLSWGGEKGLTLRDSEEMTESHAASGAGVTTNGNGGVRVKLRDKLRALELLGRHLGMFRPEVVIDNSTTVQSDVYWTRDPASDLRMA